jgi:hypothetical protein
MSFKNKTFKVEYHADYIECDGCDKPHQKISDLTEPPRSTEQNSSKSEFEKKIALQRHVGCYDMKDGFRTVCIGDKYSHFCEPCYVQYQAACLEQVRLMAARRRPPDILTPDQMIQQLMGNGR